MKAYAEEATVMLGDCHPDRLLVDRMRLLAVTRAVEIVGEAASRVPERIRQSLPDINFRQAADMRNRLIHGYGSIQPQVLVSTIRDDFPSMIEAIEKALDAQLFDEP
jgi:uncharacterized protein with HEPN domain